MDSELRAEPSAAPPTHPRSDPVGRSRRATRRTILVGVDGSPGSRAAIRYAAAEADRIGAGLRLVHVAPAYPPIAALYPMPLPFTPAEFGLAGREVLAEAMAEARHELPADRVRGDLVAGDRAEALIEEARAADLLVLGADRCPGPQAVPVGSIVCAVAASGAVPVVAVPPEWQRRLTSGDVVVAIKSSDAPSLPLLRGALETAAQRKATLRIAHVWALPPAYAPAMLVRRDRADRADGAGSAGWARWADALETRIRSGAADLLAAYDEVPVEVEVRFGQPAHELVDLAGAADLLVVGRDAGGAGEGHLGSTGRALLRVSPCPVTVLPTHEPAAR